MEKKERDDLQHEGRDQAFMDVDRMINEGLSGGSVHYRYEMANIEESRDLVQEEPPYDCKNGNDCP